MTKEQYVLSFVAYLAKLQGRWNLLQNELALTRGKERYPVQRQLQRLQVQISRAGSVYSGLCSGRLKPWETGKRAW